MNIKRILPLLSLALFALTSPLMALDPHYVGSTTVREYSSQSSTSPATVTIASLTSVAVNSGTNSYFITATLSGYEVPSGGAVQFEITVDGTAIADSVITVSTTGNITLTGTIENIAVSKVIAVKAIATGGTTSYPMPIYVKKATLSAVGLAGATQ